MSPKHHSFILVATLALLSCHIAETRGFSNYPRPESNENNLNLLINHPDVRAKILDLVLQTRGSSFAQVHNKIAAAGGNLEVIVDEINSELKTDVVKIDGDRIRIDPDGFKALLKDGVQAVLREKFSVNPSVASFLGENVNKQFADKSDLLNKAIEKSTIPLDSARKFLETHSLDRSKRSLQPRDFDFTQIVSDIVTDVLHSQLSGVIWNLLESLKNSLTQLRINTTSSSDFQKIISNAVNTLVDKGVELITVVQENIRPTNTTTESTVSRRKRAADDTEVTPDPGTDSDNTDVQDNTQGEGGGLLDIIVQPLLALLSVLLSPLRMLLNFVVNLLVSVLTPILGNDLTSGLSNFLTSLVDLLIPAL